jgi:cobalt-zinc-cadmium efflux system outer membrane protein
LDIPIETAGKRRYRIAHAKSLNEAAKFTLGEAAWKVRSRLRAALLEYLIANRSLVLLQDEASVRAEAVALVRTRLTVGTAAQPELDAVRADAAALRTAVQAAEGRVADSRATLAAAIGVPLTAIAGVTFAWPDLKAPPAETTLSPVALQRAGLLNRLDVRRALADYAAAEAALQLEVARQYPDIHLGSGYSFDEGLHKFLLGPTAALPILNRNTGPIAEAEARRKESAARFLALQASIIAEMDRAEARYRAARRELTEAGATLAIEQEREASTRVALRVGTADRLALTTMRLQTVLAERARLNALNRTQVALGALEDAVERPLSPEAPLLQLTPSNPRPNNHQERQP